MYFYIRAVVFYDSGLRTTNHLRDVEKQHVDSLSVPELRPGGPASATQSVALEAVRLSCGSDTNLYPGSEGGD